MSQNKLQARNQTYNLPMTSKSLLHYSTCTSDYTPIAHNDCKICSDPRHSKLPYSKGIDKVAYKFGSW